MNTTKTAMEDIVQCAEECVQHLLAVMGLSGIQLTCTVSEYEHEEINEKHLHIALEAQQAGPLLIGSRGEHLDALQHIVRSLVWCRLQQNVRITLDINKYRENREHSLQQLAEHAAHKAHRTGRAVVLRPMTAFERRVIHTSLNDRSDIRTESLGEEPNRRVIIKPVFI